MSVPGRSSRCLRLAPRSATNARLSLVRLEAVALFTPRFAHGRLGCFLPLRRAAQEATVRGMQPSPMRATRPNVGLVARAGLLREAAARRVNSPRARATRPKASFEPKCASWPQLHRALRSGPAGQQAHSAQLQR